MTKTERIEKEFEAEWLAQAAYRDCDKEIAKQWFFKARNSVCIALPRDDGTISQNAYQLEADAYIRAQGYDVKLPV